jgi:hypothetical protein
MESFLKGSSSCFSLGSGSDSTHFGKPLVHAAASKKIIPSAIPACDVVEGLTTSGACPISILARDEEESEQEHHPSYI